jgi:hypothetical protein
MPDRKPGKLLFDKKPDRNNVGRNVSWQEDAFEVRSLLFLPFSLLLALFGSCFGGFDCDYRFMIFGARV